MKSVHFLSFLNRPHLALRATLISSQHDTWRFDHHLNCFGLIAKDLIYSHPPLHLISEPTCWIIKARSPSLLFMTLFTILPPFPRLNLSKSPCCLLGSVTDWCKGFCWCAVRWLEHHIFIYWCIIKLKHGHSQAISLTCQLLQSTEFTVFQNIYIEKRNCLITWRFWDSSDFSLSLIPSIKAHL